ncbi:Acetyl-CoA carboxylase biotin carboxyl carrier protein [Candidatus Hepatincolaceae symbiont of Richtersius coronifer]
MTKEKKDEHNFQPEYAQFIKDLAKIAKESQLNEIEFKQDNTHIKIVRNKETLNPVYSNYPLHEISKPAQEVHFPQELAKVNPILATKAAEEVTDYSKYPGALLSPMLGMVYTSSSPEADDFVKVGDTVKKGETVLLIEAMKVFNQVKAHMGGKIKEIKVKNKSPVEYGQLLLIIEE